MPLYSYKGLNKLGQDVKGEISTDSINAAKSKIKGMNIMLIDIKEKKSKGSSGKSSGLLAKVNTEELALMTRQFATLVKAKIQIVEALAALEDQVDNDYLRVVLSEVKRDVNEGSSLAKSMTKHPRVFNNIYTNMVEAGEASGTLEVVLLRLAEFTEAQMKLRGRVKSAMMYPLIMVVIGFTMISFILINVIPQIAKIFVSMKKELPLPTKVVISMSNFMQNYWWLVVFILIGLAWFLKKYIDSKNGRKVWDALLLRSPIVGGLVKMINVSRFCSTLATLLNSGVPILVAMNIVKNIVANVHMQAAIEKSRKAVSEGLSMAPTLQESGHYPSMVTHMITLGEKSGELESMLGIISENYEEQVNSKINGLTTLLEPIMMVFMGLTIGFIVMAVVVPMMDMTSIKR